MQNFTYVLLKLTFGVSYRSAVAGLPKITQLMLLQAL